MCFDFAKAFDSVNHDIILKKLITDIKIDGLMLKSSKEYLQGRKQLVVNRSQSQVKSGVLQGFMPGLCCFFFNGKQIRVLPGIKVALYAADTKIWRYIMYPNGYLSISVPHINFSPSM